MDMRNLTSGENQFYPTPAALAEKLLDGICDKGFVKTVLEPSAGKGDLILALAKENHKRCNGWNHPVINVDFCEIDPYLRQICRYEFSEEHQKELYDKWDDLHMLPYNEKTEAVKAEEKAAEDLYETYKNTNVHMVGDDFLKYQTYKKYDLILMNPPFENGDEHLLHALELQKRGGAVACILNAETLRNPYTNRRKVLMQKLEEYGASIEYVSDGFQDAERKADVNVAIIRVDIPEAKEESDFYNRMEAAIDPEFETDSEIHDLASGNYIEQAVQLYKVETAATMELIRQYNALVPYMKSSFHDDHYNGPILKLCVIDSNGNFEQNNLVNRYLKKVRYKYWSALLSNEKFVGRLTSELRTYFQNQLNKLEDYDFSLFNIKQIIIEMNAKMSGGIDKAIMDLFDKLSREHSWYPECANNIHYYNGWKTNKAHKINKKCIIPTNGIFSAYTSKNTFDYWTAYGVISDLEKALSYLDDNRDHEDNLKRILDEADMQGQTKNIRCKYFSVDFYKKGTTHIKFHPSAMPIVDRLNIYASRKKNWLPPSYGRAAYQNMTAEEQAVVDGFHGDGSQGSGEAAYKDVMAKSDFYLAEPTSSIKMIA